MTESLWITVCRYCLRPAHPDIRHGLTVGTYCGNDTWEGETVCLWPCGHQVADHHEPRCLYCSPFTEAELCDGPF